MLEYLKLYDGGKLPAVAEKINDGGQYINQLQYKFSSDAANWVSTIMLTDMKRNFKS